MPETELTERDLLLALVEERRQLTESQADRIELLKRIGVLEVKLAKVQATLGKPLRP
jgi:hypothetical protein